MIRRESRTMLWQIEFEDTTHRCKCRGCSEQLRKGKKKVSYFFIRESKYGTRIAGKEFYCVKCAPVFLSSKIKDLRKSMKAEKSKKKIKTLEFLIADLQDIKKKCRKYR